METPFEWVQHQSAIGLHTGQHHAWLFRVVDAAGLCFVLLEDGCSTAMYEKATALTRAHEEVSS